MLNRLRHLLWLYRGRRWIKKRIDRKARRGEKIKIIIGSGKDYGEENGWVLTNLPHFDITKEESWHYFFSQHQADNLLAEHVLEHLPEDEVKHVLAIAHKYLKEGGCFRIAVPDGYHPDPGYISLVAPPIHGHLSLWTIDSFQKVLSEKGFSTVPLEYYTKSGEWSTVQFDFMNGHIIRSKIKGYQSSFHDNYSSLILDSFKGNQ